MHYLIRITSDARGMSGIKDGETVTASAYGGLTRGGKGLPPGQSPVPPARRPYARGCPYARGPRRILETEPHPEGEAGPRPGTVAKLRREP